MDGNSPRYKTRLKLRHISTTGTERNEVKQIEDRINGCSFYRNDHLIPGEKITVERQTYYNPDYADLSPLLSQSVETIEAAIQESIKAEGKIRDKLGAVADEWNAQASRTKLLMNAATYLKAPPVRHTSNVWIANDRGEHEISNMVYYMDYSIQKQTDYNRSTGTFKAPAWFVSWHFCYNRPNRYGKLNLFKIEEQSGKRFKSEEAANAYVQERIAAYAAKFTELSPPIPEDDKKMFYICGHLAPGYTVAPHEPTPDELLDFIGDGDLSAGGIEKEQPQEKAPEQPAKKTDTKKKPGHAR